jgi:hypothetical protein
MSLAIDILVYAVGFFVLIYVHELGHYLAGWAGGIPARDMRIRMFAFPEHVALREGDRWISPSEFEPYLATMIQHLVTTPRLYLYVAGGLLTETAFSAAATISLVQLGWRNIGFLVAFMSFCFYVGAVLILDVLMASIRGHACGDVSGMWALAKWPTAALAVGLLVVRVFLLWYAAAV